MRSEEIREKFLKFFEKRGHKIIPSSSLVPENDPSVLFTTAGMQPLVPYLLGEKHPGGSRLVDIQKCVRTGDIDEIGDNTHLTFFEMMGNWSLGDPSEPDGIGRAGYFKKESINWSYELLTNKEEGFGLDPNRLYVTCFEGNEDAPKDEESAQIWREIFEKNGIGGERIYFMPAKNNWWQPGPNGPCGPDTEMFYDLTGKLDKGMSKEEYLKADDEQMIVEIWNNVFMEYLKKDDKVIGKLEAKNVDTGSGFERVCAILQGKSNVFDTDLFEDIFKKINEFSKSDNIKAKRIVADHLRTAVFMIGDGVLPSDSDKGYILRRILRRYVRYADMLEMRTSGTEVCSDYIAREVVDKYGDVYPNLKENQEKILVEIRKEEIRFRVTLEKGLKKFENVAKISVGGLETKILPRHVVFELVTSDGFPFELIRELARERGLEIDEFGFEEDMKKHRDLSRAGAEQKFKGGLGDTSESSVRYHTATHLLHQALRDVLGSHVEQKGSNITPERLRFDFSHPQKMTDEEKQKVEDIVNQKIKEGLPVNKVVMKKEEAEKLGALHFFGDKYGEEVSVYFIGPSIEEAYSKEFCGGPHINNTNELSKFSILKEEAVAQGIRRIKAVLS